MGLSTIIIFSFVISLDVISAFPQATNESAPVPVAPVTAEKVS